VSMLLESGCRRVEAVSFVSPRAVPAMAGAAAVLAAIERLPGTRITALVPNLKGAELALEHDLDELTVTIAASPTYNERNVHRSIDESLAEIAGVTALAGARGVEVDAVISCAFGSPYEGDIDPAEVGRLCDRLRSLGAGAVTLADTTGMATPRVVADVLERTGTNVGLHLHETRGTGLVNAYAALEAGVTHFDCSVGGLGGSPFADGAAGNLATEDLVALLDDLGVVTGIDIERLLEVSKVVADLVGHAVPSRVAAAGPRGSAAAGPRGSAAAGGCGSATEADPPGSAEAASGSPTRSHTGPDSARDPSAR